MKRPVPWLHDWSMFRLFGVPVVSGHTESGERIVRPVLWKSHGRIGTAHHDDRRGDYKLGNPWLGIVE